MEVQKDAHPPQNHSNLPPSLFLNPSSQRPNPYQNNFGMKPPDSIPGTPAISFNGPQQFPSMIPNLNGMRPPYLNGNNNNWGGHPYQNDINPFNGTSQPNLSPNTPFNNASGQA